MSDSITPFGTTRSIFSLATNDLEINGDITMYNPVDHFLLQQFSKKKINVIETPNFLTSEEELRQYYATVRHKKKPFYQTSF